MSTPARRTPTYAPHLRIQGTGQLGPVGTAWEVFSYGISVGRSGPGLDITPARLADLATDFKNFHQRPESGISNIARLTNIKIASILPDGKWQGGKALYETSGNWPGGNNPGGTMANPPQVALAVTFRTATNTPRTRGRMFLPLPIQHALPADGLIEGGPATTVLNSVLGLVRDLNDAPGVDGSSDGVVVASSYGTNSVVTSVSVGRRLDVIRNRAADVREAYVSGPV
jgi:hypothetical protein